jgi:hypothetical protein
VFYWQTCGSQQYQSTLVQLKYFRSFNPNQWDGGNEPHGIHTGGCQRHDSQYCVVMAKETNTMAKNDMTNDQTKHMGDLDQKNKKNKNKNKTEEEEEEEELSI